MSWVDKWAGKSRAKASNFRQQSVPPENLFQLDYVVEAADLRVAIQDCPGNAQTTTQSGAAGGRRQRTVSFSLARVVDTQGSRLCLRHLGTDDRNDIWLMVDSEMLRPYPSGGELSVPFGFMNSHSVWNKILGKVEREEKLAPPHWFPPHPKDPLSNHFKIGEKVEAVDRRNAQLICPATIADIKGNFVLVSFDGWSGTFDYWAAYNSQDLFPVGWCSKSRHKLQQPGPSYEIRGKSNNNNIEHRHTPTQPKKPIKRPKSEITTKRKSIKYATKEFTTEKSAHVLADYDSDCTHLCINDDDNRSNSFKKRKIVTPSPTSIVKTAKNNVELKTNDFRNLFKMWTEKTAKKTTTKEDFDEEKKDEKNRLEFENIENQSILSVKEEEDNKSIIYKEKLSDSNSDDIIVTSSPNISANHQILLTKPPSPSIINSSVANSLIGDCKYLSETSGVSCCAKSEEISLTIFNQSEMNCKRISTITNLPSEPSLWSIDDVLIYLINKNPSLESVAQEFKNHEIDGQALLLLTMNTLRQYMKIKLGPAIKVENIIKNLLDGKR